MKAIICILLLTPYLAFSAPQTNEFIDFFSRVEGFQANFVQEIDGKKSSGVVSFTRPKNLKWHTRVPDEKVLMLSGGRITSYDAWLQSANIIPYQENELVEYLTTPPQELQAKFNIVPKFVATQQDEHQQQINYYQLGAIYFGFQHKILVRIITTGSNDEQIEITLSDMQIGVVPLSTFHIDFVEGTDIMEEY